MIFHNDKEYGNDYDAVMHMCKLQEGDIFIDIGSHIGQEIEYFASRGLNIDSYEPHPEIYKFLKSKYSGYKNITLNNVAVYDSNCYKTLYFKNAPKDDDNSWFLGDGGSTLVDRKEGITGLYGTEVKCIDIVDILNKILNDNNLQQNKIKILKIDVEGAEYHILKRLIETKAIEIPQFIFFEDHSRRMYFNDGFDRNKHFVEKFVKNNDFKFYRW